MVKLYNDWGYVKTYFDGDNGSYDITVNYIDENDGYGALKLIVDGNYIGRINLDDQVGTHEDGFASYTFHDVHIDHGESIKVLGYKNGGEYARVDSIEISDCDAAHAGSTVDLSNIDQLYAANAGSTTSIDLALQADGTLDFGYDGSPSPVDDIIIPDLELLGIGDDQAV